MNTRRKSDSFLKNTWKCIVSAYQGSSWMATLTDPATTALYSWETQKLDDWINDMHDKLFDEDGSSAAMPKVTSTATSSSSSYGTPTTGGGDKPKIDKTLSNKP